MYLALIHFGLFQVLFTQRTQQDLIYFLFVESYFGCGTIRRYGFGAFQPAGYFLCASSLETELPIMTSSPGFQLAGVETWCLAVSWSESSTRRISSKLRPVLIGSMSISLIFLSGPTTN